MEEFGFQLKIPKPLLLLLLVYLLSCLLAGSTPISQLKTENSTAGDHGQHAAAADSLPTGRITIHDNLHGETAGSNLGRLATWSRETSEPRSQAVPHETKTAILLTNQYLIKLYPLREDNLIPSGGYYVIKSLEQFNLSDPATIETLGPKSKFTRWLQYKQTRMSAKLSGNKTSAQGVTPSILPHKLKQRFSRTSGNKYATLSAIVDDDDEDNDNDLFTSDNKSGWMKPDISEVGHVFDNRFCPLASNDCLVVYWLDSRNNYLRYGSYLFNNKTRIKLLNSTFDVHANLKELANTKTIWLHESPPVDLCDPLNLNNVLLCYVKSATFNRIDKSFVVHTVKLTSRLDEPFRPSLDEYFFTVTLHPTGASFENITKRRNFNVDTLMTIDHLCRAYRLTGNNELYYSSDISRQNLELVEKLSNKPLVRELDEIHFYRDTLFFNDLATRSIMSYNMTRRNEIRRRQYKPSVTNATKDKRKIGMSRRLETTHRVIVLEKSPVVSFDIVDFGNDCRDLVSMCSHNETEASEPRVIDDDLSESITRQKIDAESDDNMVSKITQIILFVLLLILIWFVFSRRTHVDKLEVAQYNEIQT